jgi:hypothetical protein
VKPLLLFLLLSEMTIPPAAVLDQLHLCLRRQRQNQDQREKMS